MSFTSGNLESSYTPIAAGSSPFDNFDERKKKNTKGGQYAHPPDLLNVGGLDDETFGPNKGIGRPVVIFRNIGEQTSESPASVFILPIPGGLEMKDSASYDDTSLGLAGKKVMDGSKRLDGKSITDSFKEAAGVAKTELTNLFNSAKNDPTAMLQSMIKGIGITFSDILPLDAGKGVGIGLGATPNKYVTTEFTGVATRAFGFAFTLYPKSQSEADNIKEMIYALRANVYPKIDSQYLLRYPPNMEY